MPAWKDPAAPNPGPAAPTPGPAAAAPAPEPDGAVTPPAAPTPTVASTFAALAPEAAGNPRPKSGAGAGTPDAPEAAAAAAEPEPKPEPAAEPGPAAPDIVAAEPEQATATAELAEHPAPRPEGDGPPPAAGEAAGAAPAEPEPEAAVVAAAADPGDGGDGHGEAVAVSAPGRPRGPVLAAAGIVGTLLIAAPFLIPAFADDKPDKPSHSQAGGGTDLGSAADSSPAVGYGSASPSPSAKPSESPSKAAKKHVSAAAPAVEPQSGATATKPAASPSPTKKAVKKPSARALANAASSQSKVLLKNVTTGMCADVPDYGKGKVDGPVNQYYCNGTSADNQLWNLVVHPEAGKGPDGSALFLISNVKDGLCFDLPNYTAASGGTRITEYPCQATKSDNQYWWLDKRSDGTYWIRNYSSRDLCLNVAGNGNGGHDAALQIGTCNDSSSDDDHWYFAKS